MIFVVYCLRNQNMAWQDWRYIWRNLVNICLVLCAVCAIDSVNSISATGVNPEDPIDDLVSVPISGQRSVEDGEDEHASAVYGLPGTQHELRFEVGGGGSQCLFQYLKAGADLHTTFRVSLCYMFIILMVSCGHMRSHGQRSLARHP